MRPSTVVAVVVVSLGLAVASAAAAVPTRLTLDAPAWADLGEEILLEARLLTADGHPVAGAPLELRQVGAVGERVMARTTTDAEGAATFIHREYTVAALTLRVAFPGTLSHGPAHADVLVSINGVEPLPAVVMAHAPSPLIKGILFALLGSVWLTYIYAASRVVQVARERQGGRVR